MRLRFPLVAVATAALALALAPAAAAHVTVDPTAVEAGSFARFAIRVPNERPRAGTVKVALKLPASLTFVSFQPKPGWKRTVKIVKLAKPIKVFGQTIRERVDTVTWTAAGARIGPGEFDEFGMSAHVPNRPGLVLVFPSVQTYSSGEVVRWIGPPRSDEPAPRVTLSRARGGRS